MAIQEHPAIGTILMCDYETGFRLPEMVKVSAVGFHRLDLIRLGKDRQGVRQYAYTPVSAENLKKIRCAVLSGIGLAQLTKGL